MDETEFALLVSEDIKNKIDQKSKDFLRLEENREHWRDCILRIIATVSSKINDLEKEITDLRRSYEGFSVDPAASLSNQLEKSKRFRFHAEKRLAEVDRLLAIEEGPDPSVSLATFLRDAIIAHRLWHENADLVPSEGDECLYKALNGEWAF